MRNIRFRAGLSLIGVVIAMAVLSGFLGTYFAMQQRVEVFTNQDDKAVVGQFLASELLEIVQGIKTANYLQCRKEFEKAVNTGSPSPSSVSSSTVCTDWDKGFGLPKSSDGDDGGGGPTKYWVYDHNTPLQNPNSSSSNAFETSCSPGAASDDCQVYRDSSSDYYTLAKSGNGRADFRRFVTITDTAPGEITATAYVFAKDRYGNTYGTRKNEADFTASMRLYNTDL